MQPMNEHASNHVKEFHQKDHHHRLDKYVAYKMSVMALRRLEESENVLALKHHFPRLVNEINNCTYEIEHVGFQSDQIDVQLNELSFYDHASDKSGSAVILYKPDTVHVLRHGRNKDMQFVAVNARYFGWVRKNDLTF